MYVCIYIYIYINTYVQIDRYTIPVSTLLVYFRKRHLKIFLVMGKILPNSQKFPPSENICLNRFKSLAIKSFISSLSNSNFQVISLYNLHFQLQSFLLYHILNSRLYVHTCHANLNNQCLLNVATSMRKALNNQSSPKQNFPSLHLSITSFPPMLFRKPYFY